MKALRWLLVVLLCLPASGQSVRLPEPPELTPEGRALILEFETGGRAGYDPHPEWPGYASGVTWGIGYDGGYNSAAVILSDWRQHAERARLATSTGIKGTPARAKMRELRDIITKWDLATVVFEEVTVTRFFQLCQRTFPGFDQLHPNAQAAILSLVFNRGNSLAGPKRVEMRAIVVAVPKQDYAAIAYQLRKMKAIWKGTSIERGMSRRREAEARLVESCR